MDRPSAPPRQETGETDISLILGRCSVAEATALVAGRRADAFDRVRHTTAGQIRVVLDQFNGRRSVMILEIDDVPVLGWMLYGHGQEAELWVYVPLEPDEVDEMVDDPPAMLVDWLAGRTGREVFIGLARDGVLLLTALWTVPEVPAARLASVIASAMLEELDRTLRLRDELPRETRWALAGSEPRFQELASAS